MATTNTEIICPICENLVIIEIPVIVEIIDDKIYAMVDNSVNWDQPVWDHMLNEHGPKL